MSPAEYEHYFEDLSYVLPDDALVIRGGKMIRSDVLKSAETLWTRLEEEGQPPRYGLTVWSAEGAGLEQLVELVGPKLQRYGSIRRSEAGRIRGVPFELTKTGDPRHFTLWLPDLSDPVLARLDGSFEPSEPNPGFQRGV